MMEQAARTVDPARWWHGPAAPLVLILVFGAALRLYRLSDNPPGLFCDEIAIAVNARSIGWTGRNLSGDLLPLYCEERSYLFWGVKGILYQPVYVYASVPFAALLGCSPFAARLPSVLFGLLGIAGAFALGRVLFDRRVGLAAAFLLAVSPWHLQFSRIAFEAISLPAILAFAVVCLWRSLEERRLLIAGAALLGLATYAYPTAKLFVPLLLILFIATRFQVMRSAGKHAAIAGAALLLVVGPNLWLVMSGSQQERTREILIPTSSRLEYEAGVRYLKERAAEPGWAQTVLKQRALLLPFVFFYNYATYYSPGYLYFDGDPNLRHLPPGMGMCFMVTAPFLLLGMGVLLRTRNEARSRFLLGWLLLWPVPACLSIETPHAIRSIGAIPVLDLVAGLGLWSVVDRFRAGSGNPEDRPLTVRLAGGLLVAALLIGPTEFLAYLKRYHGAYPKTSASWWQAGMKEALEIAGDVRPKNRRVWISKTLHNGYLYAAALPEVDPRRLDRSRDVNGQLEPFGYQIGEPTHRNDDPRDVWILSAEDRIKVPDWGVLAEIPYPDGTANLFVMTRGR